MASIEVKKEYVIKLDSVELAMIKSGLDKLVIRTPTGDIVDWDAYKLLETLRCHA